MMEDAWDVGIGEPRDHGRSMGLHFTKQCCLPGFDDALTMSYM